MNVTRSQWLVIGLLISSVAVVGLGAISLGSFADSTSGDLVVSSTPWAANLLLALGSTFLLGLEFAHTRRRRRPARAGQHAPARAAVRAWLP